MSDSPSVIVCITVAAAANMSPREREYARRVDGEQEQVTCPVCDGACLLSAWSKQHMLAEPGARIICSKCLIEQVTKLRDRLRDS